MLVHNVFLRRPASSIPFSFSAAIGGGCAEHSDVHKRIQRQPYGRNHQDHRIYSSSWSRFDQTPRDASRQRLFIRQSQVLIRNVTNSPVKAQNLELEIRGTPRRPGLFPIELWSRQLRSCRYTFATRTGRNQNQLLPDVGGVRSTG